MSDQYFEEEEFHTSMNGGTLLRIIKQLRPHWKSVVGFMAMVGAVAALEATMTYIGALVIDEGIGNGDVPRLLQLLGVYALLYVGLAINVFGFIAVTGRLGQRVVYDLRRKMFEHLQQLHLGYYNRTAVGWIMSRVTSDSERIADLVSWGLLDITWAVMNILAATIFMFSLNPTLTLVVLPLIPVLLVIAIWFKQKILVEYRASRKANSRITGSFNEMITGVRVIKALNREETTLREFGGLTREMNRSSYRAAWYSALFLPAVQITSAIVVGAVMVVGGQQVQATEGTVLTIGGLYAFINYITFMMWPVQDLARVYASMQHAIASAERSFSLLDTKPEIVDSENAVNVETLQGEIVFEDVDFYYDDEEDQHVLRNFNLRVKPGETIALVGHTGSGKSTIVNLLCRFFEPTGGSIRINGRDYREMTLHGLQSRIGMVLQTPHLFSGNIRDNIRYGRLNASDAEVEEAAKLAGAHEFIVHLEKGYEEEVGEGGSLLSTGQKQLISLARAVLARPEIFIMDEATSSVDTLTEALIQRGMETLMQGRTSFIIAHRLSTIKSADRILVLEKGRIIEQGTHSELLTQRGHYYNLYTKQFRRQQEEAYERELAS